MQGTFLLPNNQHLKHCSIYRPSRSLLLVVWGAQILMGTLRLLVEATELGVKQPIRATSPERVLISRGGETSHLQLLWTASLEATVKKDFHFSAGRWDARIATHTSAILKGGCHHHSCMDIASGCRRQSEALLKEIEDHLSSLSAQCRQMGWENSNPYEYHPERGLYYHEVARNLICGSQPQTREDIEYLHGKEHVTNIVNLQARCFGTCHGTYRSFSFCTCVRSRNIACVSSQTRRILCKVTLLHQHGGGSSANDSIQGAFLY